jgi:protein arginine N-methyltransferase 1
VPFKLTAARTDYVHALVAHFDVAFTACHTRVGFGTGPAARPTHWKQTVFYLEETLMVHQGDAITGRLTCAPNARNPRDLDIEVEYKMAGSKGEWSGKQEYKLR